LKRYFNHLLLVLVLCCAVLCNGSPLQAAYDVRQEVVAIIREYYPDPVDPGVLQRATARAVVEGLNDPFSHYMTPEQFSRFMQGINGSFVGIGIFIEMFPEGLMITDTLPDSPAHLAGLKKGDLITSINHQALTGLTLEEAARRLEGQEGSQVLLTVMRGSQRFELRLKRVALDAPTVYALQLHDRVGYVAINSFGSDTASELENYVKAMDMDADQWILDLRGNSGGYLYTAAEVAGYFINAGNMVTMRQKDEWLELPVVPQAARINEPLILLVDSNSASAAELLAAALKDYRRALLVGETTYGKATMQQGFTLSNGHILLLTTAEGYSPLGNKIHRQGVEPDLKVKAEEALDAARLLLSQPVGGSSHAYITVEGGKCLIDLTLARSDEFWESWLSITQNLDSMAVECDIASAMHTVILSRADIARRWPVFYPDYRLAGEYHNLDRAQAVSLEINGLPDNWAEVKSAFELLDGQSGERIPFDIAVQGTSITLEPLGPLNGQEYWLLCNGVPFAHAPSDPLPPAIVILRYSN